MLAAFYLRLGELSGLRDGVIAAYIVAPLVALPIFSALGLYRAVFRYAGSRAMLTVAQAILCTSIPMICLFTIVGIPGVPRTIGVLQPLILLPIVLLSRLTVREWLGGSSRTARTARVIIYGAGIAGRELASALKSGSHMLVVGFVDDDRSMYGQTIDGIPVKPPESIPVLIGQSEITDVLLAMPSITRRRRNEIIGGMRHLPVRIQTLPSVSDIARGRIQVGDLRDLEIDDLLGREAVAPNAILLGRNVSGKTVLVTGAGGSIGSELCRQILALKPGTLLLFDVSEFALYQIGLELEQRAGAGDPAAVIVPLIGSVRDRVRINQVLEAWRPDTIYHAAAYKHVPLVEHNVVDGIANNVFGTITAARAAITHGVRDFVLISTDKAVRPTNVMGAAKRLAEMVLQVEALDPRHEVRFSMVRFGNVLNSSGSVVPLFRRQIEEGGPVTVTHPDITRYFMTIPEAAQLVIQAGGMALGGDVFVLDMGDPVRIADLARSMVELSGLSVRDDANPQGDIEIAFTGLRPGEKLYEELLIGNNPERTRHPCIMKAKEHLPFTPKLFWQTMNRLEKAVERGDAFGARELLREFVPEFQSETPLVDWVGCRSSAQNGPDIRAFGQPKA
jgi:FlaA1/EpsC-like NDP-sugar epimerase